MRNTGQRHPASASIPGDTAVSPNTGRLFTIGILSNSAGFGNNDIGLYAIDLSTKATTGGASISLSGNRPLLGLAIPP